MKISFITLLLISSISHAHEAHQTLEQILAERGIEVENFERVGAATNLTGEELTKKVKHLEKSTLLKSSIGVDHDSEEGQAILARILGMFDDQGAEPEPPPPGEAGTHGHSIFDNRSFHFNQFALMRANDWNGIYAGMSDDDLHKELHDIQVRQARAIAINDCSRLTRNAIPVFTGPQNLLDALYGNTQNVSYVISEGLSYYCTAMRTLP